MNNNCNYETEDLPVSDPKSESLSGKASTQQIVNEENQANLLDLELKFWVNNKFFTNITNVKKPKLESNFGNLKKQNLINKENINLLQFEDIKHFNQHKIINNKINHIVGYDERSLFINKSKVKLSNIEKTIKLNYPLSKFDHFWISYYAETNGILQYFDFDDFSQGIPVYFIVINKNDNTHGQIILTYLNDNEVKIVGKNIKNNPDVTNMGTIEFYGVVWNQTVSGKEELDATSRFQVIQPAIDYLEENWELIIDNIDSLESIKEKLIAAEAKYGDLLAKVKDILSTKS